MDYFKKIDSLIIFYLLINIIVSLYYYGFFSYVLMAEDLWNGVSLYSDSTKNYKTGDIILVNFKESIKFNVDLDNNNDKKLVIKLIPDKLLFDYLPNVDDTRSSQKYHKYKNKDQVGLQTKLPLKITSINNNNITLEGRRQFQFNNQIYVINIRAETVPDYIKNNQIDSSYLANLLIQVETIETPNQNLQLEQDKIQINDETKRKIFLEYLKKILEEQNINVP
jgi:hypothetical protein